MNHGLHKDAYIQTHKTFVISHRDKHTYNYILVNEYYFGVFYR